jgi:hypothetical protein
MTDAATRAAWTRWFITRGALKRLAVLLVLIIALLIVGYWYMIVLPDRSHHGPLPALTSPQADLARHLQDSVEVLAGRIGHRNVFYPENYEAAAQWLESELAARGYAVTRQSYTVTLESYSLDGEPSSNIIAERRGTTRPDEIVVIGGHYDSVLGSPGANDNASGTAAVLALADLLKDHQPARTLRFVLFANEEPPLFWTEQMGSLVYARACRAKNENIVAMLSIETIGYYSDAPGSQRYPQPFDKVYPDTGNFIGFVGNLKSRRMLHEVISTFRQSTEFPSEGGALPALVPGVGLSDHWAFWQCDYPGLMITDTAMFRYPHYHKPSDTPDKLDYERMARVVSGLEQVVRALIDPQ